SSAVSSGPAAATTRNAWQVHETRFLGWFNWRGGVLGTLRFREPSLQVSGANHRSRASPHPRSTKSRLQRHPGPIEPLVFVPFVDEVLDPESSEPRSLTQFQNVGNRLCGRFSGGTETVGNRLFFRGRFPRSFVYLFG